MAETATAPPGKMTTQHEECNGAIDTLREIAKVLKTVGDENVDLELERDTLKDELAEVKDSLEEMQPDHDELLAWREALEDCRRGVITQDELYERTVDR